MTKLAEAFAHEEGFYIQGSKPQRNNNPLDLEHAPGEEHIGMDPIGRFETVEEGWAAGERQLGRFAARGLTLREAIYIFAPPSENDTARYLEYVCNAGLWPPDTLVSAALADG